jgi:hypothetical protein
MHDYVHAVPGDVPELRFSDTAAQNIRKVLIDLGARLSDPRSGRKQRSAVAAFAPDVHGEPARDDAFHRVWDERMRAEILTVLERVLRSWDGSPVVRFADPRMIDDWFIALAQARWLYVRRDGDVLGRVAASKVTVAWVMFVQDQLILAATPPPSL